MLLPRYTKVLLQGEYQQFYDHMIHGRNLNPNLTVRYGKQEGQLQQLDWLSSQYKSASQYSSTKAQENTTQLRSLWTRLASTSGQAAISEYL